MPTIATSLSEYIINQKCNISSFDMVRIITSTGAKLYISQIENLERFFRNSKIFSMYGLTECKRVSYLEPDLIDEKPDSVGKPMPNVDIDIVDEYGRSVKRGQVGTLIVRGSNVCVGYWNDKELTDKIFVLDENKQKTLVTNDLFWMDKEGDLYFVGRKDDIIKCSGFRISLQEISRSIMEITGVKEECVVAIDDERFGKKVIAYIVLQDDISITVNQIRKKISSSLGSSALCPQEILIVDSLPRNENGKISYIKSKIYGGV